MSTGTLVAFSGIVTLAVALTLTVIMAITSPHEKRKIQERMKEKY